MLAYAIAFALRRARKIIRGLKEGLTEDERYAVADHGVSQLKERGDPLGPERGSEGRARPLDARHDAALGAPRKTPIGALAGAGCPHPW
jgi:hypothetical protein